MQEDLRKVMQKLRATAAVEKGAGVTIPAEAYTHPALYEAEREQVIRRSWICLGRVDEVPSAGSYMTADIDRTPVLVVRQEDDSIKAFVNVCIHRSMIVAADAGKASDFSCSYHGWTYGIDGALVTTPAMPRTFDKSGRRLKELRLEQWLGFIFVNLDDDATPLAPDLKELEDHLAPYQLEKFQTFRHDRLYAKCNWKVAVENGLETYHLTATHGQTLAPFAPIKNVRMQPARPKFQHYDHLLAEDVEIPDPMPENFIRNDLISPERKRLSVVGGIYPSMVYVVGYEWAWWISCQPVSVNEVRIDHGLIAPYELHGEKPDPKNPAYYFMDLDTAFVPEDIPRVEGVQRGLESGFAMQSPLHPLEEPSRGFLRYLVNQLDRYLDLRPLEHASLGQ